MIQFHTACDNALHGRSGLTLKSHMKFRTILRMCNKKMYWICSINKWELVQIPSSMFQMYRTPKDLKTADLASPPIKIQGMN